MSEPLKKFSFVYGDGGHGAFKFADEASSAGLQAYRVTSCRSLVAE